MSDPLTLAVDPAMTATATATAAEPSIATEPAAFAQSVVSIVVTIITFFFKRKEFFLIGFFNKMFFIRVLMDFFFANHDVFFSSNLLFFFFRILLFFFVHYVVFFFSRIFFFISSMFFSLICHFFSQSLARSCKLCMNSFSLKFQFYEKKNDNNQRSQY